MNYKLVECGESLLKAAMRLKPYLNSRGRKNIDKYRPGIGELTQCVETGDIRCQRLNFEKVGATVNKELVRLTKGDLRRVFERLIKEDDDAAKRLGQLAPGERRAAARVTCGTLARKAVIIIQFIRTHSRIAHLE